MSKATLHTDTAVDVDPDVRARRKAPAGPVWPMWFVLASLVALAVVPILASRSIGAHHRQLIDVVEPARSVVTEIHLQLALGRSGFRDFLTGGNPMDLEHYRHAAAVERSALGRLAALVASMDAPTQELQMTLAARSTAWHEQVARLVRASSTDPSAARLALTETNVYEQAILAAGLLDVAIGRHARSELDASRRTEQRFRRLALQLIVLALGSGLVVSWLARGVRQYADDAERGRLVLEEVLQARSQLVRGITHDLKNPLGVISGYAQLLEETASASLGPKQLRYVKGIEDAAAGMSEIIRRILELARAEGSLRTKRVRVDPADLVSRVVAQYRTALEGAGLMLSVDTGDAPRRIRTDPARVGEVLANLLSNAGKYTPAGGCVHVTVRTAGRRSAGDGRWTEIAVRDDGPGIPETDIARIFEEFTRGPSTEAPGSGLGLAIARRIARLLGGDVTVASEVGRGSTFTLRLPA